MKKIFFAVLVLAGLNSCSDTATTSTKTDSQEEKNLAANKVIVKAFETGDVSGLDSAVAEDFLDHTDRGDFKGRDSLKAMVKMMHSGSMKDMKMVTVREVADGEYVWSWMKYSGTSDGSMGMPKGPYDMDAVELSKYKDGKAIEHWGFMEMQDMMKMMPPQPGMHDMNKMDTTKMK